MTSGGIFFRGFLAFFFFFWIVSVHCLRKGFP